MSKETKKGKLRSPYSPPLGKTLKECKDIGSGCDCGQQESTIKGCAVEVWIGKGTKKGKLRSLYSPPLAETHKECNRINVGLFVV